MIYWIEIITWNRIIICIWYDDLVLDCEQKKKNLKKQL